MNTINNINGIREQVIKWKKEGLSIGLVPTMGYLHEGHESLIEKAKKENDRVVVSIFINPLQFGVNEDLKTYPSDIKRDSYVCKRLGVNTIFHPDMNEMYFDDFSTFVYTEGLSNGLCGESRPTHFRGVCTVVIKLFNIVSPNKAYFGNKDAQQLAIIKKMVRDLNIDIEIIGCTIVREIDGLAKSSRNTYLNEEERKAAVILNHSLKEAKKLIRNGEKRSKVLIQYIKNKITSEPLAKIDYINIVDINSMEPVDIINKPVLVAIAVFIGRTRLIDNFTYDVNNSSDI
jgi:pantoate--beta-alanine ligase